MLTCIKISIELFKLKILKIIHNILSSEHDLIDFNETILIFSKDKSRIKYFKQNKYTNIANNTQCIILLCRSNVEIICVE